MSGGVGCDEWGGGPPEHATSVRVVECRVRCEAHVLRLGGAESEQHPRREGAIAVRVSGVGGKHLLGSKGWGEGEGKGGGKGGGDGVGEGDGEDDRARARGRGWACRCRLSVRRRVRS